MYSFWKTTALFLANLIFIYILLVSIKWNSKIQMKYIHLGIIISALLYTIIISAILTSKYEPFFFEVSPHRKACLEKQVSLNNTTDNSLYGTCDGCCSKGTKGGIPARYNEYGLLLGDPEIVNDENALNDNWIRNDWFNSCNSN